MVIAGPALSVEAKGVPNSRLVSAAHEFEASMMQELLKPLQKDVWSDTAGSGNDDDSSASSGTLITFASEAMAKSLSEHGGFGIAKEIIQHLRNVPTATPTGAGPEQVKKFSY